MKLYFIGVHINFAEGMPVTYFNQPRFLDTDGYWDINKTGSPLFILNRQSKASFLNEIDAQIEKAISSKIKINHLDSHLHLHTLPAFYQIFIEAARHHKLKLRLAQTYRESSYLKFYYRKYINNKIKKNEGNYTDLFETVEEFLKHAGRDLNGKTVELMVHPDFDANGKLFDHVSSTSVESWINYLHK